MPEPGAGGRAAGLKRGGASWRVEASLCCEPGALETGPRAAWGSALTRSWSSGGGSGEGVRVRAGRGVLAAREPGSAGADTGILRGPRNPSDILENGRRGKLG
ncbi:hypothetical protein NN561_019805 [Cricetulus griseus]